MNEFEIGDKLYYLALDITMCGEDYDWQQFNLDQLQIVETKVVDVHKNKYECENFEGYLLKKYDVYKTRKEAIEFLINYLTVMNDKDKLESKS